ncbi:indole-3-glycerol phosphate synthase [Bacteroidia bacterium]|nr:indole-3-glycerol phosphate synthase [Bacteroidia bacterium]
MNNRMQDILSQIVANKRIEVAVQKQKLPLDTLIANGKEDLLRPTASLRKALLDGSGIIAEFKRKSPSKGWLFPNAQIKEVVPLYEKNGASACSVLTDEVFFGGKLADLQQARALVRLPLLRKDFVVDEYQLYEARIAGADAVLLIASILTVDECKRFAEKARELGLEVLLEIHDEKELSHLHANIDMVGVNNRNLGTFHTDVENSFQLVHSLRAHVRRDNVLLVSESGISKPTDVKQLREVGFSGFLIGERFMKGGQPGEELKQFIKEVSLVGDLGGGSDVD